MWGEENISWGRRRDNKKREKRGSKGKGAEEENENENEKENEKKETNKQTKNKNKKRIRHKQKETTTNNRSHLTQRHVLQHDFLHFYPLQSKSFEPNQNIIYTVTPFIEVENT